MILYQHVVSMLMHIFIFYGHLHLGSKHGDKSNNKLLQIINMQIALIGK